MLAIKLVLQQFVSLARFEERVRFLVSNEQEPTLTGFVDFDSSSYLRELQLEKANKLLKRHDYSGVKELLSSYITSEVELLLDAAIQWNFAKFENFINKLLEYPDNQFAQEIQERSKKENWWWSAYEAAYLAVVRLKQGNTVEAMFHSFRAVEGLILEWALWKYKPQIQYSNPNKPDTPYIHNINLPSDLLSWFTRHKYRDYNNVGLFGKVLFNLLQESYPNKWNQNSDIKVVAVDTIDERNSTFHCLRGLQELDLFKAWKTQNREGWEARVLSCLNFIAEPKPLFASLEKASLMSKVHEELKNVLASYL